MIIITHILTSMVVSITAISSSSYCECSEFQTSTECAQEYNCQWSTTCIDKICSNFIEEQECDDAVGCAWNDSLKQCASFTSCSNYKVKLTSQCYLKDATCIAGDLNPDGTYTCKIGQIVCNEIIDQQLCDSGLYQNNQEACSYSSSSCLAVDISKCSTITNESFCTSLKCSWSTSDKQCSAGLCQNYKTSDVCSYVSDEIIGVKTLCTWMNSTCIIASDASTLTSQNCYLNTGGTYAWKDGRCQECNGTKFAILLLLHSALGMLLIGMF